jgi:hypothetical protein
LQDYLEQGREVLLVGAAFIIVGEEKGLDPGLELELEHPAVVVHGGSQKLIG